MVHSPPRQKLRVEISLNNSGIVYSLSKIPILKTENYTIIQVPLDGDAPKEFIKAYIFEQDSSVRKFNPHSWHKFIAKTAEKWYPHESVVEYMINKIGEVLGLEMNQVYLVQANGQIRFLSQYFLKEGERLTHGAEICGEHLKDHTFAKEVALDKKTARELFTFEFIEEAIKCLYPKDFEGLMVSLVKMIIFDAIVGNNDRHFYNWGVIDTSKDGQGRVRFAPVYDSARGLFWNMSDDNIRHNLSVYKSGGKRIANYIKEASPRIALEGNPMANHFDLLTFIIQQRSQYIPLIAEMSSIGMEEKIKNYLRSNFAQFYCNERNEIIAITLKNRFIQIRNLLI